MTLECEKHSVKSINNKQEGCTKSQQYLFINEIILLF